MLYQSQCGSWRLNAFSDQLQAEGLSQYDDGANDGQVAGVGVQVADEPGVDLEGIDRKRFQVREDGVAGAEVVDRDLDPHLLQLRKGSASGFDVANHSTLGDLQAHRVGVDAELVDGVRDSAHETGDDQLTRRDIDAQCDVSSNAMRSPPAEFGAGPSHHPSAQLSAAVGRFGYADERIREQQPARRVPPTDQRLGPQDLPGQQGDFGQGMQ